MDPATTVHHPPENEVDFELLWRCISKILIQFGIATYTEEKVIKIEIQLYYYDSRLSYVYVS